MTRSPIPRPNGLGIARTKVVVNDIPSGRSDDPLDLGSLEFKPYPPRQPHTPPPAGAQ